MPTLYVESNTYASRQADAWAISDPIGAEAMRFIAS